MRDEGFVSTNNIWLPQRTRIEMQSERQGEDIWLLDDDDLVDRYLLKQHRLKESEASTSSSSSSLWIQVTDDKKPWDLSSGELSQLQKQCHKLYFLSPFAGNIIDNYLFYTAGQTGITVNWTNDNAAEWWSMLEKRNQWIWLNKDMVLLSYITGECFVVSFPLTESGAEVRKEKLDLVEVHPTEISNIKTETNDRRVVTGYVRTTASSKIEYAPRDVTHFKIRDVGGVLRGRPILERVLRPLALYDDWLGSRADLNRMRARLPVIRYRSGLKKAGFPIRSLPEPGTVIDAHKDVEQWEFPSLNIQSSDAAQDAQEFKLYIAAGVNLPAYMVTGEGQTAEVIGSTPLMLFESFQGIFRTYFEELLLKMMPTQFVDEEPTIIFPEVDLRDFDRKARAIMEEYNSGLRSRFSSQVALGLNPKEEAEWMKKELGLTAKEVEEVPESILRKIVTSVLFHAPAVSAGRMKNDFIETVANEFDKRGWIKKE